MITKVITVTEQKYVLPLVARIRSLGEINVGIAGLTITAQIPSEDDWTKLNISSSQNHIASII